MRKILKLISYFLHNLYIILIRNISCVCNCISYISYNLIEIKTLLIKRADLKLFYNGTEILKNASIVLHQVILFHAVIVAYYCWSLYGMLLQNQQVFIRISRFSSASACQPTARITIMILFFRCTLNWLNISMQIK